MPPTNISTNISTNVSTTVSATKERGKAFNLFWVRYPRKTGKDTAMRLWVSMGLDAIADQVMGGLDRWLRSEEWQEENRKYVPSPVKWLSEKRWLDEPKSADADLPEYYRRLE